MQYAVSAVFIALVGYFIFEVYHQVKKNNVVRHLLETYEHDLKNPALIDAMYDFAANDYKLGPIVRKYGATRDDFDRLFRRLLPYGNFRKINRFVPIHSFFYVNSLTTLLTRQDLSDLELTQKMFNYFHI